MCLYETNRYTNAQSRLFTAHLNYQVIKKLTLLQLITFYGRKCHLDIVYSFIYDEKFPCISSINNPIARL